MLRLIWKSCFGGKVKFNYVKWNGFGIRLFHVEEEFRRIPVISLIPQFWDSEVVFDLAVRTLKGWQPVNDVWTYHWELRDLDGKVITQGTNNGQDRKGDGEIQISNKGFRKRLADWHSWKVRAIVLGYLRPHREYILYCQFTNSAKEPSEEFRLASFTIDDRSSYQMHLFLILFTILMTVFVGTLARACGVPQV